MRLSDEEQAKLARMPTLLNFSSGMFIIPPRNNLLKIARHAYGYRNPKQVAAPVGAAADGSSSGQEETIEISVPEDGIPIPPEGEQACRAALKDMLPAFGERPFIRTRVCWYTDTPKGNFLISYHPEFDGLFLATGGSGHAFKFFPVIGEKIVDAIEGRLDPKLQELWAWTEPTVAGHSSSVPPIVWTEDGTRSGKKGMILVEELGKANEGRSWSKL